MAPTIPATNTRVLRVKNVAGLHAVNESYFSIEQTPKPEVHDGEILVRSLYIGLDPCPLDQAVKEPLRGFGVGEVVETKHTQFQVGDIVSGPSLTWDAYSLQKEPAKTLFIVPNARQLAEQNKVPLSAYLGILGMPGLTAWQSFQLYGDLKAGQTIFVSSAAGGVGQTAVQYAKLKGLKVIGSAGSDDKVEYLKKTLGIDHAINYKTQDVKAEIQRLVPEGLDLYFDVVGQESLDIALETTKRFGRIITIGTVSNMNHDGGSPQTPYVHKNLHLIYVKELRIHGLSAFNHFGVFPAFWTETQSQFAAGLLQATEVVEDGLVNVPKTFAKILDGSYRGKVVIKVADL
ncbi:hypothetical protein DFQ27_001283 [Actinomortierella ambigua]|uniref:Enoyl reductase (ER) domain-containing protein n=1 Tax=Actinomortierella ambigua TaxID=1343610 RepID=A0A9P6QEA2_9FUNG|nr:hypothetical protein DFQ26_007245 [Actinomortierella ambigua]KAG0264341.1 hypothetical protein DFQ27_001283 [Actinomortierella ambigua]